jgi:hypothetical protein
VTPDERRRLDRIRSRLMRAVKADRPAQLRATVVELAADIESMLDGRQVADELCPATLRALDQRDTTPAPPPESEPDSAPPIPIEWEEGGA